MFKSRYLIIFFLLITGSISLNAQDKEFKLGLRAGHNAVFGGFAAASFEGMGHFNPDFSISGGVQYNSIGKTAVEAHPTYHKQVDSGKLSVETLLAYTNLSSLNSCSFGVGAALDFEMARVRLGYYCRLYGGQGEMITEPFNIYYELKVHCLKRIEDWNLDFVITNCEIFELERHYQPSFIAEGGFNPTDKMGFCFGIGYKPAGMFHIAADYYQTFIKTGICYRW